MIFDDVDAAIKANIFKKGPDQGFDLISLSPSWINICPIGISWCHSESMIGELAFCENSVHIVNSNNQTAKDSKYARDCDSMVR